MCYHHAKQLLGTGVALRTSMSFSVKHERVLTQLFVLMAVLAFSSVARGETGESLNAHVEIGPAFALSGWQAQELGVGMSAAGRLELVLASWVGVEAGVAYMRFFEGDHPAGYRQIDGASMFTASAGARFRLVNDEEGYLRSWGKKPDHTGNIWGNLWMDLHGNYVRTGDLNCFGADVGLGYEFSLFNNLQVGPFVRGTYIYQPDGANERASQDAWLLVAGLSGSLSLRNDAVVMPDSDGDTYYDPHDSCPKEPEDFDGFEDDDGCPDLDNDDDGVLDIVDRCPLVPEDSDGFEDEDGCPDTDNDGDGILDDNDKCPDEPEDVDGFEDKDGCPDTDNDGDGILDDNDECPDEPETVNGFKDEDGCPEQDKDDDGILDDNDKCPDEPETVNGLEDEDGCPDEALVEVKNREILGGERIFFDFGMARVRNRSQAFLEQLVRLLEVHPEYVRISIEGHTDSVGDESFNRKLSKKRSERVKKCLVDLGIDSKRLVVTGHGEKNPWLVGRDSNSRAQNRRVEFYILEVDEENPVKKNEEEEL